MTNENVGIMDLQPSREMIDLRVAESQKSVDERLALATERAGAINFFTQAEDAAKYHRDNISHLLQEEKYESVLPVMFASTTFNSPIWAPYVGVHASLDLINYLGWDYTINSCKFKPIHRSEALNDICDDITSGARLSNLAFDINSSSNLRAFNFIPRKYAEYNPTLVQLCVVVIVKDKEDNILLLKTADKDSARIRNKFTYIQGHVEIEEDVNSMSALHYLAREAEREINEEVQGLEFNPENLKYLGLLHDTSEAVSQEHMSAMFELTVDSFDSILSNEEDKHSCHIVSLKELQDLENVDNIVEVIKPSRKKIK